MSTLVLLRHGQSYTNAGRKMSGNQHNLLTSHGIERTLEEARKFRVEFPDHHFDHALFSPFPRAIQTGLNFLSGVYNKNVDYEIVDDLKEREYGFNEYVSYAALYERYTKEVVTTWDDDLDAAPPTNGGESQRAVYQRAVAAFERLALPRLVDGQNVLIVSHFYTIRALRSFIEYQSPENMLEFEPENSVPVRYHNLF